MDFGRCPRSFCQGQPVLPVGLSDITREFSVEVFCPRCHDTYHPRSSKHSNLDGAYFGTTFCHVLLLTHPDLIVPKSTESYVPRIFGFRIHESSQYYRQRYENFFFCSFSYFFIGKIIIIIIIIFIYIWCYNNNYYYMYSCREPQQRKRVVRSPANGNGTSISNNSNVTNSSNSNTNNSNKDSIKLDANSTEK